jgi:transposase
MDEWGQRFVVKFFWLQEQGSKIIHAPLRGTLGNLAVSLPTVKQWLRRFREGDSSCKDRNRPGRPPAILRDVLSKLLSKYLFPSAKNIASHFDISVSTVKDLLAHDLGLRKFTRRWVLRSRSERWKREWVTQTTLLLDLLQRRQTADFNAIATGDESWFTSMYPARTMYTLSRSIITSCFSSGVGTLKVIIIILYRNTALSSEGCTKGAEIQSGLFPRRSYIITFSTKRSNCRKKLELDFVVHMDNSMCRNA